jgi:peptidyl-prolyl cis-trans isomerase SurA
LIDRKPLAPFEELEPQIYQRMLSDNDQNIELFRSFDERMKVRHNYIFHPEAYAELEQLAETYFPKDSSFYNRGMYFEKPLMQLDSFIFIQSDFVRYMYNTPFSNKTFALDYMQEIYDQFIRVIVREMEQGVLERDYPEYNLQLNEYYDGSLLFELSNKRVWSYPEEKQAALETEWIQEINAKYPVKIDKTILKNLRKYIN